MASLIGKNVLLGGRRCFSVSSLAAPKGSKGSKMSDPTFHATGLEKFEILANEAGNDNPFDTYIIRPEIGIGDSPKLPILIPTAMEENDRIVGCSRESDYKDIVWFKLRSGEAQQCDCGVYFKLIHHNPIKTKSNHQTSI
uniref:Cytochrome c oxidase subunit 5B, mitochondrial n=1 Tax=Caligus clemensi TaxID=344056 RepID=C1C0H5_CALCM|nr:Cytochrome c oxidase subunit 5B, mitochondrial precursor [Caligus clemensi]